MFIDSKTLKEEKREELFENLKADESIGWSVDVIDPRELSAKMLKKSVIQIVIYFSFSFVCFSFLLQDFTRLIVNRNKVNLNEISHDSAIGLINRVLNMGVLLTEVQLLLTFLKVDSLI